ncbi:MAG: ABC transporter permease [Chloroflexaceae bacterium]|nr:ABC transporter permease [Chloroflexaceae bacterium]
MWTFIARRMASMLFTIWVITLVSFAVIQLPPGDYASDMISRMRQNSGGAISPELEARIRAQYGLDQPFHMQYFFWMRDILTRGDFGYSFTYQRDAGQLMWERLPMSFALSFAALLISWLIALPFGIYSAVKKYSLVDYSLNALAFAGLAVPSFLLALIFLFISYRFTGRAALGLFSPEFADAPWSWARVQDMLAHLWIPTLIVGLGSTAGLIRTMRANLSDELNKPYVNTARAKGLSETRVLIKYPVRHSMHPFISMIGWLLPTLVSGEAIVSIVLNLPTSGPILYGALMAEDMFLAAGFILMLSVLTVIGAFVSDLLLAWLDPRIRLS